MAVSDTDLERFRKWILTRGRSEGTAALYVKNVRRCTSHPAGITGRLVSPDLAPNSLHTNLAALRAWAQFTKDRDLTDQLRDLRLPPARRVRTKLPLEMEDWRKSLKHLRTCPMRNNFVRQVLLIMAIRGLRSGDVLRIRRADVVRALDSGKLVYEGKGRKRIEISAEPIRPQLEVLRQMTGWERVQDLVTTSHLAAVASNKIRRAARSTAKGVGILEMNPHRYRHTFATNFLKQLHGDPNAIVKLQRFMAWESMTTAARYVDAVSLSELDAVAAELMSGLTSSEP